MKRDAVLSKCRTWRYALIRYWENGPEVMFIGLNPSIADGTIDDPTTRRCIGYAKKWGFSGVVLVNLFAYRATKPGDMKKAIDPIGPGNNSKILFHAHESHLIVCAWGSHGSYLGRDREVVELLKKQDLDLTCLALTKDGQPRHPLYLKKDLDPFKYE